MNFENKNIADQAQEPVPDVGAELHSGDIDVSVAGVPSEILAEQERCNRDEYRAKAILREIQLGSKGVRLKDAMKRIAMSVMAGGLIGHTDAASSNPEVGTIGKQEQRVEQQRYRIYQGVARDPMLGEFKIEISRVGTKPGSSFEPLYEVLINGSPREVKFLQSVRNGAIFVELDSSETIIVPPAYGDGSDKLPRLTLVRNGQKVELIIQKK
jgi:hypothetical protein